MARIIRNRADGKNVKPTNPYYDHHFDRYFDENYALKNGQENAYFRETARYDRRKKKKEGYLKQLVGK